MRKEDGAPGVITDYWVVLYPVLGAGDRIQNREGSCFPSGRRIWQLHLCGQCLMWAAQRSVYGGGGHGEEQFPWSCAKKVGPTQAWVVIQRLLTCEVRRERH